MYLRITSTRVTINYLGYEPNRLQYAAHHTEEEETLWNGDARIMVREEDPPHISELVGQISGVVDQQNDSPQHMGVGEVGVQHQEDSEDVMQHEFGVVFSFLIMKLGVDQGVRSQSHLEHEVLGHIGNFDGFGVLGHIVSQRASAKKESRHSWRPIGQINSD